MWKQVLFTWGFISAAFQNDPLFWWICVSILFRVVFTWYFITRNEISFLSKWPIWNRYPHWVLNAPSNESALIHFVSGKLRSQENLKPVWNFVSVKIKRYETHTVLSFILPQFMGTQVKSWLNTEVRFSTEMKSHTGLSSFRLSCEHTQRQTMDRQNWAIC